MELENHYSGIVWDYVWDLNTAIDITESSICGGGHLERFYLYIYIYIGCPKKCIPFDWPLLSLLAITHIFLCDLGAYYHIYESNEIN